MSIKLISFHFFTLLFTPCWFDWAPIRHHFTFCRIVLHTVEMLILWAKILFPPNIYYFLLIFARKAA